MLLLAAAAAASAMTFTPRTGAAAQATATVRIVRAVRIEFPGNGHHYGWFKSGGPKPRQAIVSTEDGPRTARLIEFE